MPETEPTTRLIPLCQIRPDPAQPRKLLPPDLAEMLASGGSPHDILDQLRARAERDRWMRERLTKLAALAHSIGEDGLMNPIRVIPDGADRFRIEEGERRWWAHHILVAQGKERFQHIAAFVVEKEGATSGLLRRRVAENVLRSDFTAIELARAMVNRIQEMLTAEPSIKQGEAERRVGKENGISDRRVRQFISLLTLSPEVQELAQQARLTENSLRRIVGIKDPAGQLAAVRELIHPAREKIVLRSPTKPSSQRKSKSRSRRRPHSRTQDVRVSKLSSHRKQTAHKATRRKTRGDAERRTTQTIQKVLMLVRTLKAQDWTRAMEVERVRHALSGLRDSLEAAMTRCVSSQRGKRSSTRR
jgi:ParB/RepB/Spo0J family partition protein